MVREINILGVIYQVNEVDVVDKEELCKGKINYLTNEIRIDKGLVQSAKEQTLMHEILHAVFDLLGLGELNADENKVQGIATALHHVFTSQVIFERPVLRDSIFLWTDEEDVKKTMVEWQKGIKRHALSIKRNALILKAKRIFQRPDRW